MHRLLIVIALAGLVAACGGDDPDSEAATEATTTTASSSDDTGDFPCAPERTDCTSEEVIATLEQLYVTAGATESEAECLAPVTGEGSTSVSQATDAPTDAQTQAAIECVGSQERLMQIAEGMAEVR